MPRFHHVLCAKRLSGNRQFQTKRAVDILRSPGLRNQYVAVALLPLVGVVYLKHMVIVAVVHRHQTQSSSDIGLPSQLALTIFQGIYSVL